MKSYSLFIVAFAVVIASLIKSQITGAKKETVKKSNATVAYWPSEMKKNISPKLLIPGSKKMSASVSNVTPQAASTVSAQNKAPSRGIASVPPAPAVINAASSVPQNIRIPARGYGKRGYSSGGGFYYGAGAVMNGNGPLNSAGQPSQRGQFANSIYSDSIQELSSFTRTPDLSINVGVDPEMGESFEDQLRKFREQNQLTSQDLQELEVLTNSYLSMSGSVQRGQIPAPQVNAEAIKLTRSYLNLKRRVERRPQ